jgi:N-methylhydantoinase A
MPEVTAGGRNMIGVDVGGTFTDCVSVKGGKIEARKVLVDLESQEGAVIEGARILGAEDVAIFNHATTVGLNAVLTRRTPKIAFLTTEGHRDILDMGRAWRPFNALTNPHWRRSFGDAARPLVPRYLRRGVRERIKADGSVLVDLDLDQTRAELEVMKRCDVEGVAICLLNAYVNPEHEVEVARLVREVLGDVPCSLSSEVSPLAKEYARASSTVIDVLMKMIYGEYSESLTTRLGDLGFRGQLNFADCAASLIPIQHAMEAPLRIMFSGPAAGTASSAYFGQMIGIENLICCDVGGTSTDISIVSGGEPLVDTTFEIEHDLIVNTVASEIATIGAGGGSIVSVTPEGELRVGPESAGGKPGPACYGRGGTAPTTTDACLLAGILSGDEPLGGTLRIDPELSRRAFEELDAPLSFAERVSHSYALAVNNIREGITETAIQHGLDPRDFVLVAYGSAGPMLLPSILDEIGARAVLVPPHPGLFSALGLLSTDLVYSESRSAYLLLDEAAAPRIDSVFAEMERKLREVVPDEQADLEIHRSFDARFTGQSWDTPFVPVPSGEIGPDQVEEMTATFHDHYARRWGSPVTGIPVEGVTYRVQLVVAADKVGYPIVEPSSGPAEPVGRREISYLNDEPIEAAEYRREQLGAGQQIVGPAVILESAATTQVTVGQVATIGKYGEILITTDEKEKS